jgi:hypothetical protein
MSRRHLLSTFLFCLPVALVLGQFKQNNYSESWNRIDSLINRKGLNRTALEVVNNLYLQARKENNEPQQIKALIYRMLLEERMDENSFQRNILHLELEIGSSTEPAKSILKNIEAQYYWNYLEQHRGQLYTRTKTQRYKKEDVLSWSTDDFNKAISALFLSSLKEEQILKKTSLDLYNAILTPGNSRKLRPTLYDLLANRALDYFKTDESEITRPEYAFEIDNPVSFSDKRVFSYYHFVTRDSLSIHYMGLELFQKLLLFHINDPYPDALIVADIDRLAFVNNYGAMPNKEELFFDALRNITDKYPVEPAAAKAWYLQASIYASRAAQYDPMKDTANRYEYHRSKSICDKVIQETDSSEGKSNCLALVKMIMRKELRIQIEKVNQPDEPFRALVEYRNFSELHLRIIPMNHGLEVSLGSKTREDGYWEKIVRLPTIRLTSQTLPKTDDYQLHRVEIKIDSLPAGEYALLTSANDSFSLNKNPMTFQIFYVSNIASIQNGNDFFVLHRQTGQPLARANVQIWYRFYDDKQGKWIERQGENMLTDKNGYFKIHPSKTDHRLRMLLDLRYNQDHLFINDEFSQYPLIRTESVNEKIPGKQEFEETHLRTFFFMDRSLYRPGQTVYFKGIALTRDFQTQEYKILPQFKTKIILYDANRRKLDSLEVSANDFGSYSGKFRIPENLLNGIFKIRDDSTGSENSFSVEEYKRPKFYVEFQKLKGSYKLNDSIRITGYAKAYSGNPIDGAKIKYRIVRYPKWIHSWLIYQRPISNFSQQEMVHGILVSQVDGSFNISFKALADLKLNKNLDPVFDYRIIADVTDINGETRTGETNVPIGYQSLVLSIKLPKNEAIPVDSLKNISVGTENLSGEFEPAVVNIDVFKLREPDRLVRKRYWVEPDQLVMGRLEYLHYFPHDEFLDDFQKENWDSTNKIFSIKDTTREYFRDDRNISSSFFNSSLSPGWYRIEAKATDKYGQEAKDVKFLRLYDSKTRNPGSLQYQWPPMDLEVHLEPGNIAATNIGSSAKDVFAILHVDKKGQSSSPDEEEKSSGYSFLTLSNGEKSFEFQADSSDSGGIGVYYAFLKDNRIYSAGTRFEIPWTNKELTLSYESFRDKTLPGSEEKWKLRIQGYNKEKVAAEILATMYDASLDQFKMHRWEIPFLYGNYSKTNQWDGFNNFHSIPAEQRAINDFSEPLFSQKYDQILDQIWHNQRISFRGAEYLETRMNFADQMSNSKAYAQSGESYFPSVNGKNQEEPKDQIGPSIQIRKNFSETAFFLPDLRTDSTGIVEFSFTMPQSLTRWKLMSFAHTQDLSFGYGEKYITTQKQLMVQPGMPRFLREGDQIVLPAKIINLSDSELTGQIELELTDPLTNQSVDGAFQNMQANQYFTVAARQSVQAAFPIVVPNRYNQPVTYRIIARAVKKEGKEMIEGQIHDLSDGEESTIPVLSNRLLVTESLPLDLLGSGTKNLKMGKLLKSGENETLEQQALTVEYSSNAAWYAVQALPYLKGYPYECAEQTFNRFYANALTYKIFHSTPHLQAIVAHWIKSGDSSRRSNLQKNEELKSVLLQETPWVLEAEDQAQEERNIALLFDSTRMDEELASSFNQFSQIQKSDGGFPWFTGGPDDRFISQYILSGIGHLLKLDALPYRFREKIHSIVKDALLYLDEEFRKDDEAVKRLNQKSSLRPAQIQYLYMRSFFPEYGIGDEYAAAINDFRKQTQQFWPQQNIYLQGMIALSLYRIGDLQNAKNIIASLKQNAMMSEDLGMHWNGINAGYNWWQAPVETQALLIEAFSEITNDQKSVAALKMWLLKQKQTENWKTTKATADACYAILLKGTDWLSQEPKIEIKLGDSVIRSDNQEQEAGTGHFKKRFVGHQIDPSMGNITLSTTSGLGRSEMPLGWGAVYWQYFDDLDKVTSAATPLKLTKKLFLEKNTDQGPVLVPLNEHTPLQPGDQVKVRIELSVDRDMEYIQMKDMRASCMEPVNVLSEYKRQDGLSYYETVKDASTDFFFDRLPKGAYVFEYPLLVLQAGNFSNGLTSIQSMYAPEFSAHSEGIKVLVETP